MDKLLNIGLACMLCSVLFSCSLDEKNFATVSLEKSFGERAGFEGLINGAYVDLYFLHGKIDYIGPTEAGTDLWVNTGNTGIGFFRYDNRLQTTDGNLRVLWGSAYTTINLCNTAIHYAKEVTGYDSEAELQAKLAEAYFLRAFANFMLVEQFGDVVLRTQSAAVEEVDNSPQRSSEEAFYELMISDLKYACEHLPVQQELRGRATKKAAYALLAKVYLQRTRLGEVQEYAALALETAEALIDNQGQWGASLYVSDDNQSGFSKLWAGENNKTNTEFLLVQAIDEVAGMNPEFWNRGRTRQYFLPDLGNIGGEWGTSDRSIFYGRANARMTKPSKYLLTSCFEPSEHTPDTRFAETFTYKFYAATDKEITADLAESYQKDPSLVGHVIKNTVGPAPADASIYGQTFEEQVNMENDEGLAVFTPNWVIPAEEKRLMPMLVADPSDLFYADENRYKNPAEFPGEVNLVNVHPALKKFSASLYVASNQTWMGDMPIIRLGDIYLVAAEAALLATGDADKAAEYVNTVRRRAAIASRASEMEVAASEVDIDFLVKERARELAGEHMRWVDLKRMGKLTKEYLMETNPVSGELFDESKHLVRPIPQWFLDAISNPEEFGNNGY